MHIKSVATGGLWKTLSTEPTAAYVERKRIWNTYCSNVKNPTRTSWCERRREKSGSVVKTPGQTLPLGQYLVTSQTLAKGRREVQAVPDPSHRGRVIWKIRCKRAIQREDPVEFHTGIEIENLWWAAINKRLKMDKLFTDTSHYGKKAIQEKLVLHTWSGVLWNEDNLPDNRVRQSGVLVGMTSRRPPGRNR
ncbi:hypothetical protein Hypma_009807 [Hypsizygus marmoreus]|uniref:Uncharacterized protein n=1 Tax=Hypsizygus marmoreus TaxID=39966 RepID=A0A369JNW6_HYPMA|nr:hypothetical protein Hypma_009807 [Hypsizygus marmoreus]